MVDARRSPPPPRRWLHEPPVRMSRDRRVTQAKPARIDDKNKRCISTIMKGIAVNHEHAMC
eukprot:7658755-Pyramimonas_sp.AAC.1